MENTTNFLPLEGSAVAPEHLEMLGKQAARAAEAGELSLNDAVVQTIGHEKLGAEHVRRVVEIANVEAFNRKFAAMQGPLRAVHLDGGPADPTYVIQALGREAQPKMAMLDLSDFATPPSFGKMASIEASLLNDRTQRGVRMEIAGLQSKLAAAHEDVIASLEASRYLMNERLETLVERSKSAAAQGATAEEVFSAWARVHPELAKVAFARARFVLPAAKTAGLRAINPAHPVVATFSEFAKAAQAFESHDTARKSIEQELVRVDAWLAQNGA
jgi:hypothetical protein